tara:strand:- start:188 stop:328 length:141 start_codon:yes stop_codon:yes gene_type:complete
LFAREVQVNEEKERKKKGDIGTLLPFPTTKKNARMESFCKRRKIYF